MYSSFYWIIYQMHCFCNYVKSVFILLTFKFYCKYFKVLSYINKFIYVFPYFFLARVFFSIKRSPSQLLSFECSKIFQSSFFTELPRATVFSETEQGMYWKLPTLSHSHTINKKELYYIKDKLQCKCFPMNFAKCLERLVRRATLNCCF